MPRNRQQIPRDERAGDLLAAATEQFLAKGYVGTTMADISAAAGVARGNVYWYFKSKDEIFAAVMDRMLSREIKTLKDELASADPLTRMVRGLSDMRVYRHLHQVLHDRLPHSEAVQATHATFLAWIVDMIDEVMAHHGIDPDEDSDAALIRDVALAIFEGANVPLDHNRPAHEMLRFYIELVVARREALGDSPFR